VAGQDETVDFDLTEEQTMLRDTVAAYLGDHYDFAQREAAHASGAGWRPDVWRAFAEELGILGAAFPEELGGFGGGAIENMVLMEEFGKALILEPYLSTVVIGGGLLRESNHLHKAALIGEIIAGKMIVAFAHSESAGRDNLAAVATQAEREGEGWTLRGRKQAVIAAPFATHLIVTARTAGQTFDRDGISVFLVERETAGVKLDTFTTADGLLAANVDFQNVRLGSEALVGPADGGLPLVELVVDEAIAATCAEACGVMRRLLDSTVAYAKERRQFGQSLGSFQVLQHRMADMFIQLERSISMTYMANIRVADPAQRSRSVSAAKVLIGRACRFVGENAVQIHGGMGMTQEMAISHYFKRATMLEGFLGSVDHHYARFERLSQ
jgi:alkylation response protein AidB-like acyl-CoA dehydrogenase